MIIMKYSSNFYSIYKSYVQKERYKNSNNKDRLIQWQKVGCHTVNVKIAITKKDDQIWFNENQCIGWIDKHSEKD